MVFGVGYPKMLQCTRMQFSCYLVCCLSFRKICHCLLDWHQFVDNHFVLLVAPQTNDIDRCIVKSFVGSLTVASPKEPFKEMEGLLEGLFWKGLMDNMERLPANFVLSTPSTYASAPDS